MIEFGYFSICFGTFILCVWIVYLYLIQSFLLIFIQSFLRSLILCPSNFKSPAYSIMNLALCIVYVANIFLVSQLCIDFIFDILCHMKFQFLCG